MSDKNRGSFKGSIGFVLAAAGSAVGLGNIWRFPYLAARDGGGLFLLVYLILAVTFGFTLLTSEVAIGRKTKQSPLTAYKKLNKKWGWIGVLQCIVPFLIMPYYCVIGGWVLKYFTVFVTGQGMASAEDGYFGSFITANVSPIVFSLIFLAVCGLIVIMGVSSGIEKSSKILMPILFVMVIAVAFYSLNIEHQWEDGTIVSGLDGLQIYMIPNVEGLTPGGLFKIVTDALGQLFFSLSIAMGIMITYGSYVPDEANMVKSINQIEFFDTAVAFLAGIMIVPAVYAFNGMEGLEKSGPSLIFVSLPKIFMQMGLFGHVFGAIFFAMVLFAALTSAVSILEAVVSSFIDKFDVSRNKATVGELILAAVIAVAVCLGYNMWYFELTLPNGSVGQILDILDYITNYCLMPVIAIATCIFIGWSLKPDGIIEEVTKNGEKFSRKGLYIVMVRFIAPVFILVLFLISTGILKFK
ncbi:MAG: sodium-dependent transporter [Clostridiales bacterium]|nr:sodium-dependent transporter [Clostridiales bacterium]